METTHKTPDVSSDLRASILDISAALVRLIDAYAAILGNGEGEVHTAIIDSRKDAYELAFCAALETIQNDDNKLTDDDSDKAEILLQSMGVSIKTV